MVLGVLFYLLQASQFLQEGMTYRLGVSFYMAWAGAAFFLLAGQCQAGLGGACRVGRGLTDGAGLWAWSGGGQGRAKRDGAGEVRLGWL